ncbi:MAG: ABC transporter substrate-binding protein, partial [Pseudomonadota bacterium]
LAAPAIAQQSPRVLRMATSWPGGLSGLAGSVARVAAAITEGSGGALRVDVYPAGTLVPPLGVHDAVGAGEVELYHSVDYYYQKKHRGLNFFSTVPMGLTAMELIAWINHGGGQALWDEVNARFGVKAMAGAGRRFTLAAVTRDVLDVINLTGFQRVLTLADTVDAACAQD